LDISGNAQFPNYLTTGTLLTTFSTSAALNTTYNTSNSVRIYSNTTAQSTGIGISMYNAYTGGNGSNTCFGNNALSTTLTNISTYTGFGYSVLSAGETTQRSFFGSFIKPASSSSVSLFGSYINVENSSPSTAIFGAFCLYKKTSNSSGFQTLFGYAAGYNSNTAAYSTYAGYQAGQYDITGLFNTYVGTNTGQIVSNTFTLQRSTAIGNSAKIDVSNQIVFGTTSERLYVPGSYVGIGKFLPGQGYRLDVSGNMRISTGGLFVSGTGTFTSRTTWSDYRIKENVVPLSEKYTINNLNPVGYYNQLSSKQDIGFIAHEVQEVFPDLVVGDKDAENYQTINYIPMFALLVKEVKEMKREIEELRKKLYDSGADGGGT
jgi:hypothetical protein